MRAVAFTEFGGPEVLTVLDLPTPAPAAGQILVKVVASPVNPVDTAARAGYLAGLLPARQVYVPGVEFSGVVAELGARVDGFGVGQSVIGLLPWLADPVGAAAEYVVIAAEALAPAPHSVDPVAASTLALNGITADLAVSAARLAPGQRVLVTGAAGGVGGYAVQLAAARGAQVIAVASAGDADLVRALGATDFLDRAHADIDSLRALGLDVVIDAAVRGAELIAAVRDGGRFAALLPPAAPESERGITVHTVQQSPNGPRLAELATLVDAGTLTPRVADTLPLREAGSAHARFEKGGLRGRLVLLP
ncbi:NADP-dependent oxidoreductase [Nocardia sp. NBC_01503]|uniref:NADP-dependent oxidoreductase n=1 Tax=Nocardia sp. NBC_01503 TaxID=2975997 RepID=UPI002E7BDD9A|nr:NADP-dependent oxidoreductase [Nocardia sp. NBC_01503]WTL31085.1 NADP-dependent oxidoreductase [Nocardia sp. NBC_01503]